MNFSTFSSRYYVQYRVLSFLASVDKREDIVRFLRDIRELSMQHPLSLSIFFYVGWFRMCKIMIYIVLCK